MVINVKVLGLEKVKDLTFSFEKVNGSHSHPEGDLHSPVVHLQVESFFD